MAAHLKELEDNFNLVVRSEINAYRKEIEEKTKQNE